MKTIFVVLFAALQLTCALPSKPSLLLDTYIINGEVVKQGEFPHQLLLEKFRSGSWSFACGAVLLSKTQALTAAHCVDSGPAKDIRLSAGVHKRSEKNETQTTIVKKVVLHPTWNQGPATFSDDIAVLTFETPITFNDKIQPISWNDDDKVTFAGQKCFLTGWGRTELNQVSDPLKKASLDIISNAECQTKTLPSATIYAGHICAYQPSRGSCSGDSGGPMTCEYKGKHILAGVTSWGVSNIFGQCNTNYPSVYSRTSFFKDFIKKNLDK